MLELVNDVGDDKGWTDAQRLEAVCSFVDQMSEGETDAETFLESFEPTPPPRQSR